MKKSLFKGIDFADSMYHSMTMEDYSLTITLTAWNEKKIILTFTDIIQFVYKSGDITQGVVEIIDNTDILQEALTRNYVKIPSDHPYHLYQILDIYDFPYIEIVAATINAAKVD